MAHLPVDEYLHFSLEALFHLPVSGKARPKGGPASTEETKCSASGEGMDAEWIIGQIVKADGFDACSRIASDCSFGSSRDVAIAGTAQTKCEFLTPKLSRGDRNFKATMTARCQKICNPQKDGTLCQAILAHCRLDVSKFLYSLNSGGS